MGLLMRAPVGKLPVSYERAREALERCNSIDECKTWKDKAAALASYAKQADDQTLFKNAVQIRARAVRRMGEIAKEVEASKGGRPSKAETGGGAAPSFPKGQMAALTGAGLSRDQAKDALRVASIPKRDFERAIEAEKPPTLTALATMGTKPAPPPKPRNDAHLEGRDPKDFAASTRAQGALRDFVTTTAAITPVLTVRGSVPHERAKMLANARGAILWLERLLTELEKVK